MLAERNLEKPSLPMIFKENNPMEKIKVKTGNENIDRILAGTKFAKLRQQLQRPPNCHNSGRIATLESESSEHEHLDLSSRLDISSSSTSNLATNDDYDSSIPAKFLPTHGLPFTLRSSSLGFSKKLTTELEQNGTSDNAKGRSSLSVPIIKSRASNTHRVRFVTEAVSEDNIMSRKVKSLEFSQDGGTAERTKRRVDISNLPPEATSSDIFSLVWGGRVEWVKRIPQTTHASVLFADSKGCARYLNATKGGISNAFDEDDRVILIENETSSDPEMSSSDCHGFSKSRCVKITGSVIGWEDAEEIETLASDLGCAFEFLELKKNCKLTALEIRFLSIGEAQSILSACKKEKKWSHLDIEFCVDPCALANGIHQ